MYCGVVCVMVVFRDLCERLHSPFFGELWVFFVFCFTDFVDVFQREVWCVCRVCAPYSACECGESFESRMLFAFCFIARNSMIDLSIPMPCQSASSLRECCASVFVFCFWRSSRFAIRPLWRVLKVCVRYAPPREPCSTFYRVFACRLSCVCVRGVDFVFAIRVLARLCVLCRL